MSRSDPQVSALSFDERLALLVDAEWLARENKRLQTALREAKLRVSQACIEDIDYAPRRELDRALLRQLATGRWIAEHHTVVITGATGTGKTYLACALAQQACRQGYRALYRRVPRLCEELTLAHADGSYIPSSPASPASTCSFSTTRALGRSAIRTGGISSKSSKTVRRRARRSSPVNCHRTSGTIPGRPHARQCDLPTGSSTPPTGSC